MNVDKKVVAKLRKKTGKPQFFIKKTLKKKQNNLSCKNFCKKSWQFHQNYVLLLTDCKTNSTTTHKTLCKKMKE